MYEATEQRDKLLEALQLLTLCASAVRDGWIKPGSPEFLEHLQRARAVLKDVEAFKELEEA
jgi:hypothetical protein